MVGNPVYEAFQRVVAGGGRQQVPAFHYPTWDRWFEAELFPLGPHVAGLWRDVTETVKRKRAEESLRAEKEAREQILGIVAHDLRSPIAAIRMAAAAVASNPATGASFAQSISETAQRLDRRIASLLDFSIARFGSGIAPEHAPSDLDRACRIAVSELRAARPDCEVALAMSGDLHGHWDCDRILQVLGNLLDNGAKHGDGYPLQLSASGDEHAVRIAVHNVGSPIAPDLLPHIFEPFRRGPRTSDRRGAGLGLYVARQIVSAHGGEITVLSPDGDGTTFVVTLPRRSPV